MSDLTKFLESKKTNPNCTVCGQNAWVVPQDAEQVDVAISQKGGFVIPAPSVPAYLLVCGNCGHIVLFASAIVRRGTNG